MGIPCFVCARRECYDTIQADIVPRTVAAMPTNSFQFKKEKNKKSFQNKHIMQLEIGKELNNDFLKTM